MNQTSSKFMDLGVDPIFADQLEAAEYHQPSKIQEQAIPVLLEPRDVLGIAQTGTGKTAAFGLPLLQRLHQENQRAASRKPRGLILAPTRELAMQISKELKYFAKPTKLTLTAIYGGVGQGPQVKSLRGGIDILVATPGRLLDLVDQNHLQLDDVSMLVLDEADRLLDMGFIRDVQKIVDMTPQKRQSLLFSATLPPEVTSLAQQMLEQPKKIDIAPKQMTVEKIEQKIVHIDNGNKRAALEFILKNTSVHKAIVFARTKHGADKIAKQLKKADIEAEAIHGNKSQNARVRTLEAFKSGKCWVLVATDVASRGIDIDGVSHVINYELPHEPESYVHRIGRTGRAGADGIAWSLVDPTEKKRLKAIERLVKKQLPVEQLDLEEVLAAATRPQPGDQQKERSNQSSKQEGRSNQSANQGNRSGKQNRGKKQNRGNSDNQAQQDGNQGNRKRRSNNKNSKPGNHQPRKQQQSGLPNLQGTGRDDLIRREEELQAQGNVRQPKRRKAGHRAA